MSETGGGGRKRGGLFDDLAGVAGGAFSALAGLRTEMEAMARSQAEALVQRMELVRREELDAALEVARRAREQAEALEARVAALEARLAGDGADAGAAAAGAAASPAAADDEALAPREAFEPPAGGGVSGEERTEASPGGV
jgi:BMFP domain-containing protein YqiC